MAKLCICGKPMDLIEYSDREGKGSYYYCENCNEAREVKMEQAFEDKEDELDNNEDDDFEEV